MSEPSMQTFKFHWRDGKTNIGEGYDVAHAFSRLGYGGGAIRALDYYETLPLGTVTPSDGEVDGNV